MATTQAITVPDIGDFDEVEVIEILVSVGDQVQAEDPLLTLETDKAAMDIPAPHAGTIASIEVAVGDKVSQGDVIVSFTQDGADAVSPSPDDAVAEAPAAGVAPPAEAAPDADAAAVAAPDVPAVSDAAPIGAGGGIMQVLVPDIGDFDNVEIIEVAVRPGDRVEAEATLITLESDKAALDIPAPAAGTVIELFVALGDQVSEGHRVLSLSLEEGVASPAPPASELATVEAPAAMAHAAKPAPAVQPPRQAPAQLPPINEATFNRAHASPSVRKFARELGVDLMQVQGTGLKSRVTRDDVKALVKSVMSGGQMLAGAAPVSPLPEVPVVDFAKFGPVQMQPLTRVQKISGPRLHASWVNLPHVTQHDEADSTDIEAARKQLKPAAKAREIRLTPLAFVIKACAEALSEFPVFKSSLTPDGEQLVMKDYTHIGFAADTPNGLVVPVIRDADQKDAFEIAQELADLSALAREGKLKAAQMQGGCFTVSSLGGIGGTYFTPIINAPEVAILGVGRSRMAPLFQDNAFVPRLMLPLSLSYDHRVIDGAAAVRFTTRLGQIIAAVDSLLPDVAEPSQ